MADGLWEGWIEFAPLDGGGEPVRSPRETTQPKHADAVYWAGGLTPVYLEGALERALKPLVITRTVTDAKPMFDKPADAVTAFAVPGGAAPVLDPFSVYEKGELVLRRELGALAAWHLVNIIRAYDLSDQPLSALNRMPNAALVDRIVAGVRARHATR